MSQTATVKSQPATATRATYLLLSLVIIFWAANWVVMKQALAVMSPPLFFTMLRLVGAALAMLLVSLVIREPLLPLAGERFMLAISGIFQIAGMLGFATAGLAYVGPGRAAVLVYTLPLWALPCGWLLAHERITTGGLVGGLVGFLGIALFVNPWLVDWRNPRALLGNALVMCAGLAWAIGASVYRRRKWSTSFWTQTWWMVLWSAIVIALIFVLSAPHPRFSTNAISIGSLAYNWFIGTALCYWWWGKALSVLPAARLGQIVTLIPVLAFLMSAAVYGEHIGITVIGSMVLIILGIMITLRSKNVARPADLDSAALEM
jgi:drug/metabolite transporter (DMT)-like permease